MQLVITAFPDDRTEVSLTASLHPTDQTAADEQSMSVCLFHCLVVVLALIDSVGWYIVMMLDV